MSSTKSPQKPKPSPLVIQKKDKPTVLTVLTAVPLLHTLAALLVLNLHFAEIPRRHVIVHLRNCGWFTRIDDSLPALVALVLSVFAYAVTVVIQHVVHSFTPVFTFENREYKSALTGVSSRLQAAHNNLLENLPLFFGSVLFAKLYDIDAASINSLVTIYLLARLTHYVSYSLGIVEFRAFSWMAGNTACYLLLAYCVWGTTTVNDLFGGYVNVWNGFLVKYTTGLWSKIFG